MPTIFRADDIDIPSTKGILDNFFHILLLRTRRCQRREDPNYNNVTDLLGTYDFALFLDLRITNGGDLFPVD